MTELKLLLIALFLLQFNFSFSQKTEVDSLLKEYKKCKTDSSKIDIYLSVAAVYLNTEPSNAIVYGKKALADARKIHDCYREQLALLTMGMGYEDIGDINNAFSYFNECYKVALNANDIKGLAEINLSIGILYSDIGNQQLALEYYTNAYQYFSKANNQRGICKSYLNMSDALYNSNNSDKALFYLQKALEISRNNNGYILLYIYSNISEAYCRKKEFNLAKENVLKGLKLAEKSDNLYILSSDYLILAKIYLAFNDVANAEIYIKKGFEIAEQTGIKEVLIDSYDLYSQVLKKQKKFHEALQFENLYINTKDSVQSSLNNNLLQAYETEKKDMELAIIKTSELQKDAELKKQHFVTIIILSTLLLLISIAAYVMYSSRKIKNANFALEEANNEINEKQKEIVCQNNELSLNNEKIIQQSNHIEELNNIKDRLFAIISHDLRSPLNNLRKTLDLVINGKLSKEQFQTVFPMLDKSLTTVSNFLDNLLEWSKSQLKGESVERSVFDISLLIKGELELLESQAAEKQIILSNQASVGINVFADRNMIDLVVRNLISNAIKFCYPNGNITVYNLQKGNDMVEISVKDNGKGIALENIGKVFQNNGKYTTLGTNNEMGTGLGLLLCKNFIEKLGGEIGVESIENEGARFWFTLPSASF